MDFAQLLAQPESKILEFKKDLSSLQPILKTLVAFANTAGGTLIIGVAPDKKLVGLTDVLRAEEKIANAIADAIEPSLLPEIEVATVNKKDLLIIKVSYWKAPFYLKKQGLSKGVYIRLGSTSRPASLEMIAELQRSVIHQSYDQQAIPELSKEGLDLKKVRRAFKTVKKDVNETKLRSIGILVPSNHGFAPSVGGLILFGKNEHRGAYFPEIRVRCARFKGKTKTHILDQHEVEGTLLDAVEEVPKFISRNTQLSAEIENIRRKDIPEYPSIAIREILINALVHADYSIQGSSGIQIAIFDGRLEIQNPGMLPFGFTMEDLKAGVSRIRNRVIAKIFHELHLMEEWGSGYQRVIEACRQGGYREPEWVELGTTMRVTLFSQKSAKPQQASKPNELTERQQAILALFERREKLPFRELYRHFSEEISERTLRYELAQLKKEGLLNSKGRGPSTSWERS
ncbi:MAG: putative DNA binding domain-containing protein [Chlamydiales bacterium]|nr:putative DNA binding domain-containing protein [Chlamydiales bacterium]